MNKLEKMGRIRYRLLKLKWINSSRSTSMLLNSIIKRSGIDEIEHAIDILESEDFTDNNNNDFSSKVFILFLSNKAKETQHKYKKDSYAKNLLKDLLGGD